ncbi:DUF2065 domain-containing protein [Lysobacter koreensis]|uniref:DUF2065 domain-containing protein n=1 Tax=Lysobacter koreensis TaxID=266122 RepID=A0ABW2YQ96_9GAMM
MGEGLLSALCLVAVLEGLLLFAAPGSWKRAAAQLYAVPNPKLRVLGAVVTGVGLLSLWVVRG